MYDLIIIGASAAGSAAAIYAARRNLNFLIVTKDIGGEVALSGDVDNWPGIIHTTGVQLAQDFYNHVKSYNVQIDNGIEVKALRQVENHHVLVVEDGAGVERTYATKSIIVASGIHPRLIGVPGEEKLRGRGVTYCTVCDGPLYKNKVTATVGAGNAGLESALMMAGIAKKVYFITKYPDTKETQGGFPKGETILINKVKALENVEIIYNANTIEILGDEAVNGLRYEDMATKEPKDLEVQGVMVHVGMIPNSSFIDCVKKNPLGEIEIDFQGRTSCQGIFAAGDVTSIPFKQISIAVGQGAAAALTAIDYLNRWK